MKVDSSIQLVKGMRDILSPDSEIWLEIEAILQSNFEKFGYQHIRTPILEKTRLFVRSVGEGTDIVDKEMFQFNHHNGDSLCMRPELTASIVRALIEGGLMRSLPIKTWTIGPAFRRERPQKGRFRQFYQADVEVFGVENPAIESELILLTQHIFKKLGIENTRLEINTLGDQADRQKHRDALNVFFKSHFKDLDEDSQNRVDKNPLRILDSKNPKMQPLIDAAPKIDAFINPDAQTHFNQWQANLNHLGIEFQVNSNLVRGIDYYNRSVFEWICEDEELGSGSTICGGGRYDYLVAEICNTPDVKVPAIGFAIGLDRLVLLKQKHLNKAKRQSQPIKHLYLIHADSDVMDLNQMSLKLLNEITQNREDLVVNNTLSSQRINKQFDKAIKSGADLIITLGDEKLGAQSPSLISVKNIHSGVNHQMEANTLLAWLNQHYPK